MINKSGTAAIKSGNSSNSNSLPSISNGIQILNQKTAIGRVTDIILDENHPDFIKNGEWNGVGNIYYKVNNSIGSSGKQVAKPFNPQNKNFPLINEFVLLFQLPNSNIGEDSSSNSYYYTNTVSVWNHPHHNAYPDLLDGVDDDAQSQDYQSTESGSVRRVTDGSTEINLNSPSNPSQNTFVERTNIHPLMPFMGNLLYEGRFGNSIRLGGTAKSNSIYNNNWSINGENGDPITIIRNGQPKNSSNEGWLPITEDINKDLSSIYLTSTQKIPFQSPLEEKFNGFSPTSQPITPSNFTLPQILLNSNRILINSKTDSILIGSEKSINLSATEYININSKNLYIDSQNVRLGNLNATESLLLGDTTIALFDQLLQTLLNLTSVLESDMIYPGGVAAPNAPLNIVASNTKQIITQIQSQLDSTKSKISKTI